jgi:hypothetical protein
MTSLGARFDVAQWLNTGGFGPVWRPRGRLVQRDGGWFRKLMARVVGVDNAGV